jgi:hypothetical protein
MFVDCANTTTTYNFVSDSIRVRAYRLVVTMFPSLSLNFVVTYTLIYFANNIPECIARLVRRARLDQVQVVRPIKYKGMGGAYPFLSSSLSSSRVQ